MKKIMVLLCVLFLGLVGCSTNSKSEKKFKIGVIQIVQHDSLDTIRTAFENEIKKKVDAEIVYKNANGDIANLDTLASQLVSDNVDVIVAIATPSAQAAAKYATKIPIVFAAVTDPIGAKLVSNLEKPDKNITGTSDEIQVDQILDLATFMYPKTKKIGFLYNSSEANSESNLKKAQKYAKDNDLELIAGPVSSVADIQPRVQSLMDKTDIIFAPNDNMIASSADLVTSLTIKNKFPLFVGADSMVKDNGLASVGIDYKNLGIKTAHMTVDILNGVDVSKIPVAVFKDDLNVYINKTTAKKIGFKDIDKIKKEFKNVIEVS